MQTDTGSELESDTSSIHEGVSNVNQFSSMSGTATGVATGVPLSREQLEKRIESLIQENRVLKIEIETYKLRVKSLQEENKELRKVSVNIQARAEQEEEYISNKLLKKIQSLKKEKEQLANNYEREEEFLTNDLSRKLNQLRNEKVQLEQTLEQEQEHMVNKLMRKIEKLEAETSAKQTSLEQLRKEKIELENTLEQEQESLVNRLWKRMERLEAEKRLLQEKLDQPVSAPMSPRSTVPIIATVHGASFSSLNPPTQLPPLLPSVSQPLLPISTTLNLPPPSNNSEQAANLTEHIINLRREVSRLKATLEKAERDHRENMAKLVREEKLMKEENIRLQRRLQMEVDRREALCRHLSESESSLEMDDERHFNESTRVRTISSPVTYSNTNNQANTSNPSIVTCNVNSIQERCHTCNQYIKMPSVNTPTQATILTASSPPLVNQNKQAHLPTSVSTAPTVTSTSVTSHANPNNCNPLTASSSLSSSSSSINSSSKQQFSSSQFTPSSSSSLSSSTTTQTQQMDISKK